MKEQIRAQQKAAVREAEDILEKLEQEIAELRRGDAQLEELSCEEDPVHFIQVASWIQHWQRFPSSTHHVIVYRGFIFIFFSL